MKITFSLLASLLASFVVTAQQPDRQRLMELFSSQQYEEAVNYLRPAVESDPDNIKVLEYLAYAYMMSENPRLARDTYAEVSRIDPNNVAALRYLSRHALQRDPDSAIQLTTRLLAREPGKPAHYRQMGEAYGNLELPDSALLYYSTAYDMAPTDYRNAVPLAQTYIVLKDFVSADSIIAQGLINDSLNVPLLSLAIHSAYLDKRYERVLAPGETLIALEELLLTPLSELALSYYHLEQYEKTLEVCEYLISNDLATEALFYYQAKAYAQLGEFNKSNDLLQMCLDKAISKNAELYYYSLGENFEKMRRYRQAVSHYDTAFFLFRDPLMKYKSARIYEADIRDTPTARSYYAKYLNHAKPETEEEKRVYEYVKKRLKKK